MNATMKLILSLSLSGSILALILFSLKLIIQNRLSKTMQYYLWVVVLLRLTLPFSFDESLMNRLFYNDSPDMSTHTEQQTQITPEIVLPFPITTNEDSKSIPPAPIDRSHGWEAPNNEFVNIGIDKPGQPEQKKAGMDGLTDALNKYGLLVWLLGALIFLSKNIFGYLRFIGKIKAYNKEPSQALNEELLSLLKRNPRVLLYRNPYVTTPMLIGAFRPMIIIPDTDYTEKQLKNILMHEMTHVKRGDIFIKWLIMLSKAIHWFNPLVHYIGREIEHVCELACDEAVIRHMDLKDKQSYGDTLISVVSESVSTAGVLQATMSEDKKTLKERLVAIMRYKSKSNLVLLISVILLATVVFSAVALGVGTGSGQKTPYNIFISTEEDTVKIAMTGTYNWSYRSTKVHADSDHPINFNYKSDNYVNAFAGKQLAISTQKLNKDKRHGFTLDAIEVYKNGQLVDLNSPQPHIMNSTLYLQVPHNAGEYVYSLTLSFKNRGTVNYGFVVMVHEYNLSEIAKHRTPYVGDHTKVSAIAGLLPVPDSFFIQRYISLDTERPPFGATVFYEVDSDLIYQREWPIEDDKAFENKLMKNALVMFCMIDNVDNIIFAFRSTKSDGGLDTSMYDSRFSFKRTEIEEKYGNLSLLSQDLKLLKEALTDKATAFKGLELYVWRNHYITGNDDIYYTLLPGTNRNKMEEEIYNLTAATNSIDSIKQELSRYTADTHVFIYSTGVDAETVSELSEQLKQIVYLFSFNDALSEVTKAEELTQHAYSMEAFLDNSNSRFTFMNQLQLSQYMSVMPEVVRDNYEAVGRLDGNSGYVLLTAKEAEKRLPKNISGYYLSPADTHQEQLVLEDEHGQELCKFPLGLHIVYYRDLDIFYMTTGVNTINLSLITQISRHQLAGNYEYIEYAKLIKERGASLFNPGTYPYLHSNIWMNGSNLSEYISLEAPFVKELDSRLLKAERLPYDFSKRKIQRIGITLKVSEEVEYSLCILDDGSKAFHRWDDLNTVIINDEVYDILQKMAMDRTSYMWVNLHDITEIVKAQLIVKPFGGREEMVQTIENPIKLSELENLLLNAVSTDIGSCPYNALLHVFTKDGAENTFQIATDSCGSFILGSSACYEYGSQQKLLSIFDNIRMY